MERSIEDGIFEKAKESLKKLGMYAGEKERIDYDPNINSISKRTLEYIIEECSFYGIHRIFKDLHTQHRKDIKDSEILKNVRSIMRETCNPEELIPTIEYLENEGLLNKSELALSLMQYAYDSRVEYDKDDFEYRIDTLKSSFWHNYQLNNPDVAQTLYQATNLDANRNYEMAEEKFVEDWILGHYGTSSLMHTSRNDFYSGELSENDFSFVIVDAILKEYGVDVDPEEVKKLFNERVQQLQKGNMKKQELSPLQKREEELSSLEMERKKLLDEKQKDIGK